MSDRNKIHRFDNGICVYDHHLIEAQRERYKKNNVHEAEEEEIFKELITSIDSEGCYLNIGCAIGYYPILARKLMPKIKIYAAEPLQLHREYFKENICLNGFSIGDFNIISTAFSSRKGAELFKENDFSSSIYQDKSSKSSMSFIGKIIKLSPIKRRPSPGNQITRVKTTTIDHFQRSLGKEIDLIQMDVQGFEENVLKGAEKSMREKKIRNLLIGTHGIKIHDRCISALSNEGYRIHLSVPVAEMQPDGILVASL